VTRDLCSSKSLKIIGFEWKEMVFDLLVSINIQKVRGKWAISISHSLREDGFYCLVLFVVENFRVF